MAYLGLIAAASLTAILSIATQAAPLGPQFTYQGELEQTGTEVTDVCDFRFELWDAAVAGAEVAPALDILNVAVDAGRFTVALDFGAGAFDGDARWLEIAVACPAGGGLTTLAPRQEMTAAPHALFALEAGAMAWSGLSGVPAGLDDGDDVMDADADPANELQNLADVLMRGNDANGLAITNLAAPAVASDAATMAYVDAHADGDADDTNELQNLFETVDGDAGSTTADTQNDTLSIVGAGSVSTAVADDTLTITGSGVTETVRNPVLTGSLGIGTLPQSVFVSGRYAYVVDAGPNDLKVIDVTDPAMPAMVGNLSPLGGSPQALYVSGRYAYVVDFGSDDLKVIDVSDPSAPALAGMLALNVGPEDVHVSGRYAYVVDRGSDGLNVIDVSDPGAPTVAGSLGTGETPRAVYVSGPYAYVVHEHAQELSVIDVSDPGAPALAGSLNFGSSLTSVYVSGRYAYVLDGGSNLLHVVDVSDPGAPVVVGSLGVFAPLSVHVSGRYAYVTSGAANELRVIDVSDPTAPSLAGSLAIGDFAVSLYVSGRYAYVVDIASDDLKVIDVSGTELPSLIAHSLETGNLQVRNDMIAQGQLHVTGGMNLGAGGLFSDGNVGVSGTIAIANDIAPTTSPANLVQLYAEDVAANSELKVRDEAGNVTTLSPHNFLLIGGASEPMAWSFYSENTQGKINVDMLRTVRLVEEMSGQKLVHIECKLPGDSPQPGALRTACGDAHTRDAETRHDIGSFATLLHAIKVLERENERLRAGNEALERRMAVLERRMN